MRQYTIKRNIQIQPQEEPPQPPKDETNVIMLKSITYAYKAKNHLESMGLSANIMRTPVEYNQKGCGYSVRVKNNASGYAEELKNMGIKVIGVLRLV